jgi:hypothetical protein
MFWIKRGPKTCIQNGLNRANIQKMRVFLPMPSLSNFAVIFHQYSSHFDIQMILSLNVCKNVTRRAGRSFSAGQAQPALQGNMTARSG